LIWHNVFVSEFLNFCICYMYVLHVSVYMYLLHVSLNFYMYLFLNF
jgi:hypothetical protein